MKIAVEGCCHGELNKIYETLQLAEQRQGIKIDLLICCGDFQAVRNNADLGCMAVPAKYRQLMHFHEYYSGKKRAPILTLFVGGNHEASNHLWELGYGGWVAPNIYYLGYCGVVQFGGLRIAGLSGIYKPHNYRKTHFEKPPYNDSTVRSAYHVRSCDHFRLKQYVPTLLKVTELLSGTVDIMLSHDWPQGIELHGDTQHLLRIKPHFRDDISTGSLGSPPAMDLLQHIQPSYWFSAHLHVKFPALYQHKGQSSSETQSDSSVEVQSSIESSSDEVQGSNGCYTRFLSLDKCLPRRSYLQIVDLSDRGERPYKLSYDPEWLAIIRSTEPLMSYAHEQWRPPVGRFAPSAEDLVYVEHTIFRGDLTIPDNFVQTVPAPGESPKLHVENVGGGNPQTERFCEVLGITNPFKHTSQPVSSETCNPDEISIDDEVSMDTGPSHNPDEISLDDDTPDGGWCIDTGGSRRAPLNLPPPTNTSQPDDNSSQSPSHDNTPESHESASTSHDQPKIKRRNIALYTTPDEEEETIND